MASSRRTPPRSAPSQSSIPFIVPSPHIAPAAVDVTVLVVVDVVEVDVVVVVLVLVVLVASVVLVAVDAPPWLEAVVVVPAPPEPSLPVESPKSPSVSMLQPVRETRRPVASGPRKERADDEGRESARYEAINPA